MAAIGFIGLGVMGRPMAEHLVLAGHEVTVHNRSEAPVRALVEAGAKAGASAAEAAAGMLARSFEPGFRVDLHHKDMQIVQAAARDAGWPSR